MGREMSYPHLQLDIHNLILNLRSIENTVNKPFFERLWKASTDEQKEVIKKSIERGDKIAVNRWMDSHPDVELGEMSQNKLKKLAQRLHVAHYSRLNRYELEDGIREKRKCNQEKK